jgi:NitT/TauT family transport system substrate-binding protein
MVNGGLAMGRALWLALLSAFLLGCGGQARPVASTAENASGGRERVTLRLNWFPEVEHGGYYDALIHGDYTAEGLDVQILPGGVNTAVVREVGAGQAMFGVANADGILVARSKGVPVVALMAPMQSSPYCIMVHESSGIRDLTELRNVTLAMIPGSPYAIFLKSRVPLVGVTVVPYLGHVGPFLKDPKFAQQGYVFSEPILAADEGSDPRALLVSDIGYNPYSTVLLTADSFVRARPDVVERMVRASIRGWRRYIDEPGRVNRRLAELNPAVKPHMLAKGARALRPLVLDGLKDPSQVGQMTLERWQTLLGQLEECRVIDPPGSIRADQAIALEFLGGHDGT